MNQAMMLSLIRSILLAGGGIAVAKGWITEGQLNEVVGAVLIIAVAAWDMWEKKEPKQ